MLTHAKQNGLFTLFSINLLFPNNIKMPEDYSESSMKNLFTRYDNYSSFTGENESPHIIVFLIEAFTDPLSSGIKTTRDPIPFFRMLSENYTSGNSLVPVIGGKSANSEFELLTGLSMRYLQKGSIPYIEHLNKPINSFVSELKRNGYQTHAIHVANLGFFNYKIAYPNLGFDQISTLKNNKDVKMDVADRFPSEQSLVDKIIQTVDQNEKPKFIFAFPNSTHGFWNYPEYLNSSLDVLNKTHDQDKNAIKTYINALNTTDKAIESLVTHFQGHQKKTIILFLGDHYPGLLSYLKSNLSAKENINGDIDFSKNNDHMTKYKFIKNNYPVTFYAAQHKVPYVIWTNFETPVVDEDVSINLLHTKILSLINYKQSPFLL
ncbi:MAG: LTA synthase family protein [Marinicella sp.]